MNSVLVPMEHVFTRTWDSVTPSKAGEVVFDRPRELIELLRPVSLVANLGPAS